LADYLDRRREDAAPALGLEAAMDILQPIAAALARAHRFAGPEGVESIVHRDLKPANIFLTNLAGDEGVKILDFGIAKVKKLVTERRDTGKSLHGETSAFTPGFAAPEQWLPKRFGPTGTYTDVWGLALTLVETLSGLPPIDGELLVMRELALDEARRPTPRSLGVALPERAEKAFQRALAVEPRKRTQRIEELWTELESALGLPASLFLLEATREPSRSSPRLRPPAQGPASQRPAPPTTSTSSQRAYASTMPSPDYASAAKAVEVAPASGDADALAEAPVLDLEVPEMSSLAVKAKARPPPPPVRIPALEPKAKAAATPALALAPLQPPALADDDLGGSLESVPLAVDPVRSTRPRPRPSFTSTAELYRPSVAPPKPSLAEPGMLIALGVVGAAAERYLGQDAGQPYMIGPVRLAWIAGVLALVGAAWMASRLLSPPRG
ncbi:MAG TPA: protein kinase, partial [Byssovorax sp.]